MCLDLAVLARTRVSQNRLVLERWYRQSCWVFLVSGEVRHLIFSYLESWCSRPARLPFSKIRQLE